MKRSERRKIQEAIDLLQEVLNRDKDDDASTQDDGGGGGEPSGGGGGPGTPPGP